MVYQSLGRGEINRPYSAERIGGEWALPETPDDPSILYASGCCFARFGANSGANGR